VGRGNGCGGVWIVLDYVSREGGWGCGLGHRWQIKGFFCGGGVVVVLGGVLRDVGWLGGIGKLRGVAIP